MKNMDIAPNSSKYTLVENAQTLAKLNEALAGVKRAGIDTEGDSLHHYFEKVCLIQLSFENQHYIIDPLANLSLSSFFEVLAEKELIFQGADYDLRMLKKSFGFRPARPVFDTMLAAQILGYEKIGLAALAEKFCGVLMSKSGQKADWSKRPLSEGLLTYASDDTKYLERIADAQTAHLQELNRLDWHRESCEKAVKVSGISDKSESKEEAWRIKGSSKADPGSLVYIFELWKWRDEEARKKDRPPFMIIRNEDIIEIAEWRAKNPQAPLRQGPPFLKRFSGEIFANLEKAVLAADQTPHGQRPQPRQRAEWRDERPDLEKLDPLLAACKILAQKLRMEPSILASRGTLTAVVQYKPQSIEQVMEVSGMMKWQAELMMPAIKNILGKN